MSTPKFNTTTPSIYSELKIRINSYFKAKNIPTTGNYPLYIKAIVLLLGLVGLYVHLVFFTPPWWLAIPECLLMGLITAGIGFNIMHDGAHGSFSRYPKLNLLASFSLDMLGGSSFMWNTKHNIIHHAYTNVDGVDDDIDAGFMLRMAPQQKAYWFHRYQHRYFWGLYSFLYLYWVFLADYQKYFTRRIGPVVLKKIKFKDHLLFWVFKVFHLIVFVALPIYMVGLWPWLIGFLVYTTFSGLILSLVFQLAHVVEETSFPEPVLPENRLEDEWAMHQLKTTANFATRNKWITWWVGGLNFQVEHHLFPRISHIHYPEINRIIRETCAEFQWPYIEHPSMVRAIASHVSHLKTMGRG